MAASIIAIMAPDSNMFSRLEPFDPEGFELGQTAEDRSVDSLLRSDIDISFGDSWSSLGLFADDPPLGIPAGGYFDRDSTVARGGRPNRSSNHGPSSSEHHPKL